MAKHFLHLLFVFMLTTGLFTSKSLAKEDSSSYWPTEGWRSSSPEAQGMKSESLVQMMQEARKKPFHSVMIIRNGYIVAEAYFPPYDPKLPNDQQTLHPIFSCTKSITSALIGIAIKEGFIKGVNQKILDFFPEMKGEALDPKMSQLTLRDILTLTEGMDWTEETDAKLRDSDDPVKFFLRQPIVNKPGTAWRYNNGSAYLLSVIVARATGMDTLEYAKTRLFAPLGITHFEWPMDEHGNRPGHSGISMTPRDMAKFGYLYMMGGVWDGKQILDSKYIRDSFGQYSHTSGSGYGYLWWTNDWFSAATGYMNQNISVSPRCKVVAVFTGWFDEYTTCPKLVGEYALRAIKSNRPLPENPEVLQELKSLCGAN